MDGNGVGPMTDHAAERDTNESLWAVLSEPDAHVTADERGHLTGWLGVVGQSAKRKVALATALARLEAWRSVLEQVRGIQSSLPEGTCYRLVCDALTREKPRDKTSLRARLRTAIQQGEDHGELMLEAWKALGRLEADQRESDVRLAWVELEFHPDWPPHEQMVAGLGREETHDD